MKHLASVMIVVGMTGAAAAQGLEGSGPQLSGYAARLQGQGQPVQFGDGDETPPAPQPPAPKPQQPEEPREPTAQERGGSAAGLRGKIQGEESGRGAVLADGRGGKGQGQQRGGNAAPPAGGAQQAQPPQQRAQAEAEEFLALIAKVNELNSQIEAAEDKLAQNALIQEVRLARLAAELIRNPEKVLDPIRDALLGFLRGDPGPLAKLPPRLYDLSLRILERTLRARAKQAKGLKRSRLRRLAARVRKMRRDGKEALEQAAEVRDFLKEQAELLKDVKPEDLLEYAFDTVVDKVVEEAKDFAAKKLGKKALGGLLSIYEDLSNFSDAMETIETIEDLEAFRDATLFAAIARGSRIKGLGLDPTSTTTFERDLWVRASAVPEGAKVRLRAEVVAFDGKSARWKPTPAQVEWFQSRANETLPIGPTLDPTHEMRKDGTVLRTPFFQVEMGTLPGAPAYVNVTAEAVETVRGPDGTKRQVITPLGTRLLGVFQPARSASK